MADRILIADDTETVLDYLELVFEKNGFETLRARGGAQAIALATERSPDLALVDVMMPDIDGFEVCRRLRAEPSTSRLPILLYSSVVGQEVRAQARAAGADEFLGKSLHHAELVGRVRDWLATRSLPGGLGEPALIQVALDLLALLEVDLIWLLTRQSDGWRSAALASEQGEQQARGFLEKAGFGPNGITPAALAELPAGGKPMQRLELDQVRALAGGRALAEALAGLGARGALLAPIGPGTNPIGLLIASAPAALATSGPAAQRIAIGLRYATIALERRASSG